LFYVFSGFPLAVVPCLLEPSSEFEPAATAGAFYPSTVEFIECGTDFNNIVNSSVDILRLLYVITLHPQTISLENISLAVNALDVYISRSEVIF